MKDSNGYLTVFLLVVFKVIFPLSRETYSPSINSFEFWKYHLFELCSWPPG